MSGRYGHSGFGLTMAKVGAALLGALIFMAGIPVALGCLRQLVPALLMLLVPLIPIAIALGFWRRRW